VKLGSSIRGSFSKKLSVFIAFTIFFSFVCVNTNAQTQGTNPRLLDALVKETFYNVDTKTELFLSDIDAERFLNDDPSITLVGDNPKILIFHTHSTETYFDSKNIYEGVIAVGKSLKEALESQYGIPTMHVAESFDMVNGQQAFTVAYERMEIVISKLLKENPSIEIAIDLHRDAVPDYEKPVTTINGEPTAQIMFFNGICRLKTNGKTVPYAPYNEYISENLSFSFNMQVTAEALYKNFAKKIYIAPYRYSLAMLPKSLLIEVGAQTNTAQEAKNAAPIIAEILTRAVFNPKVRIAAPSTSLLSYSP